MKLTPSGGKHRRMTLAEAEAQTARDKRRILILGLASILLFGAYIGTRLKISNSKEQDANLPAIGQEQVEKVYTLPFEDDAVLATIHDGSAEERSSLAGQAVDALLKYSVTLAPRNYEALGIRDLTPELVAELLASPQEHRKNPLRIRGELIALRTMPSSDPAVRVRQLGTIRLDDGQTLQGREALQGEEALQGGEGETQEAPDVTVHVVFLKPTDLEVGSYVRMDGLFVQAYRGLVDGEPREGPLVAGNRLIPSQPLIRPLPHDELVALLRDRVKDDTIEERYGEPNELWDLMAYAASRATEIDWSSAEVLDNEKLGLLCNGGTFFRGQPFRFGISRNLGIWTEDPGENPLHIGRISRGWLTNSQWRAPTPLVQFISPLDLGELQDREVHRLVTGKGFFLKNVVYERADGRSTAMAPLFVVSELEDFIPPVNRTPQYILMGVAAGTILMIVLIFFLVRADSRSSRKLQEDLVRRRRERRLRSERNKATL